MKIGLYGGTFDPPHLGHVHVVEAARKLLGDQTIVVMPDSTPPHKAKPRSATALQRLEMARLAFGHISGVEVSDLEIRRGGISYTADTVRQLRQLYPGCEPVLIMGTDMFLCLESWREPKVLFACELAVVPRNENEREQIEAQKRLYVEKYGAKVQVSAEPAVPLSSTRLRNEGLEACLLPEAVLAYIRREGLYGGA
ncbi:MAG: nicotinate (nicotinamide) nucleotide adenylyltransferase [Clostridia bacterium]|nr:nicotinate (nicotinamide) nucleotide adenylyltransferase [Clostridia bacterium]